jgi:hypothetical protein
MALKEGVTLSIIIVDCPGRLGVYNCPGMTIGGRGGRGAAAPGKYFDLKIDIWEQSKVAYCLADICDGTTRYIYTKHCQHGTRPKVVSLGWELPRWAKIAGITVTLHNTKEVV